MSNENNFFQNIFLEKQTQSKNRLYDFLQDPGEKQIHDLRTSIRRLEALYTILPTSCKGKKSNTFVSSYKTLFKKNSTIRDLDIITKKLLNYKISEDSKIILDITNKRDTRIKKISKLAKKTSELQFSHLKKINEEKIIQKNDTKIFSLVTKVQNQISVVISNESKVKELHSMRKTTKRLRYVLEIEFNVSYQHILEKIKSFQDLLGSIHDCDITVDFLQKYAKHNTGLVSVLSEENKKRKNLYEQLSISLLDKKN